MTRHEVSLPQGAFPWESQARQYPRDGEPGISYFAGETPSGTVDCLLYRNDRGALIGILNYYAQDFPPWEKAGNVNIWVRPDYQRRGIGTALWQEAVKRWGATLSNQRFTVAGAAFADALEPEEDS